MDKNLQKAIASSRPVDNLRLLLMSHIEGASGTSQLLYESLIASEMEKLGVQPRDFFQTIISILTQIRNTFPPTDQDVRFQRTVTAQTPSTWAVTPSTNEASTDRPKSMENPSNLTGGAMSEPNESRVAFQERQNFIKPEPLTPLDTARSSNRLAIQQRLEQSQSNTTGDLTQELTGFNPNVTIRRWKKTKTRPVTKIKKELRTPIAKKKRGRPINKGAAVKTTRFQQPPANPPPKTRPRGRPPSVGKSLNGSSRANLTDSTNPNSTTCSSIHQQPSTFISTTIKVKQEPMS